MNATMEELEEYIKEELREIELTQQKSFYDFLCTQSQESYIKHQYCSGMKEAYKKILEHIKNANK